MQKDLRRFLGCMRGLQGQSINIQKSSITFSPNVDVNRCAELQRVLELSMAKP